MAYENLCMYCFEENGGEEICPHCHRDARLAVPQIQLLPGTLVYNDRFLIGRALGQDAGGIVYAALDTRKGNRIRIREYLPRDIARRLDSGAVVPEPGAEDQFERGMTKLRASVEGVEDPAKRHFFFEENGTGYIAQRKQGGGEETGEDEAGESGGNRMALVVGIAAVLVIAVAAGVIALVNYFTNTTDDRKEPPSATALDLWTPPVSPSPTPYATGEIGEVTNPTHSWMDWTDPDLKESDKVTPVPTPTGIGDITIGPGASQELILKLQRLLTDLGWLDEGHINGKYDSATKAAVSEFQEYINRTQNTNLTVDGLAGKKTLSWLLKTDISVKPSPTPALVTPSPTLNGDVIDEDSPADRIRKIQNQLIELGILPEGSADGIYGKTTRSAVKKFQKRVNELWGRDVLTENGTCDAQTQAYLDYIVEWWGKNQPTPVPAPEVPSDVVDENSPAESIRYVQQMLKELGYLKTNADGVYGSRTYTAVRSFQEMLNAEHGSIVAVTGKCDRLTLEYLEYYYENRSVPTRSPSGVDAPTIVVTGAEAYNGGVYLVGSDGVRISWSADGAVSYSVSLTDADNRVIRKEDNTVLTLLTLTVADLSGDENYNFIVKAIPAGGDEADGISSYVRVRASASSAPTPTAAALVPEVKVTGALGYADGTWQIGAEGTTISWSAAGAESFSLYLTDTRGNMIAKKRNTTVTQYIPDVSGWIVGEKYTLTIRTVPKGKTEQDGGSASVSLCALSNATPTPAVTPSRDLDAPVIRVSNALGSMEDIWFVGEDPITVTWSASGNVRAYSVYIFNEKGATISSMSEVPDRSMNVSPVTMTKEQVYTIKVIAIPEGGTEKDGKFSSVRIELYTGQTPTPTIAPVQDLKMTVTGARSEDRGIWYAGNDGIVVSWTASGKVTGYDILVSASDGSTVWEQKDTVKSSVALDPEDLPEGEVYTVKVTAIPDQGTSKDGPSAFVRITRYMVPVIEAPRITVEDAVQMNTDGSYAIEDGCMISWICPGAAEYDLLLAPAEGGKAVGSVTGLTETRTEVNTGLMKKDKLYLLTLTAYPEAGEKTNAVSSEVLLVRYEPEPTPTPAPTPITVGQPEVSVSKAAGQEGDWWIAGRDGIAFGWAADNAKTYDAVVYDESQEAIWEKTGTTEKTLTVKSTKERLGQRFVLEVKGIAKDGTVGKSTYVRFMFPEAEPTPTPKPTPTQKPTPTPIAVGQPEVSVVKNGGQKDGWWLAKEDGISFSWAADNAKTYDAVVYDESQEAIWEKTGTTEKTLTVKSTKERLGQRFVLEVKGIAKDGTVGKSTYVKFMFPEAEPTPTPKPTPTQKPTPTPIAVGQPEVSVVKNGGQKDGWWLAKEDGISFSWAADHAKTYNAVVYDESQEAIWEKTGTTEQTLTIRTTKDRMGQRFVLEVQGIAKDGTVSRSTYVKFMFAEPEPTATPTPAPVKPGKLDLRVTVSAGEKKGYYIATEEGIAFEWFAENAAAYDVVMYDEDQVPVKEQAGTREVTLSIPMSNALRGNRYALAVTPVSADGTKGETGYVKIAFPASAVTPEPEKTEPPRKAGRTSLTVTRCEEEAGGIYSVGADGIAFAWSAEGAVSYNVALLNADQEVLKQWNDVTVTEYAFRAEDLPEGEICLFCVEAIGSDGAAGPYDYVKILRPARGTDPLVITPESDEESVLALQTRLFELGWISDPSGLTRGRLDAITARAVQAFQAYAINRGRGNGITPISEEYLVVDGATLTLIFDLEDPLYCPE